MAIWISNRQRQVAIRTALIKRRLEQMMVYLGCADKELSVVLSGEGFIQDLNCTYRQQDRSTNVLAFPQQTMDDDGLSTVLLGDVVVALPVAAREAAELQQTLEDRVSYLVLHGLLHLLGYDHEGSAVQRRRMEQLEQRLLAYLQDISSCTRGI
jgi:probable rRNA maturation factor